ncbi:Uncharacterised protein [Escherichia coli]|nr:Uncharacterised protein [Escherichia coli]
MATKEQNLKRLDELALILGVSRIYPGVPQR